MKIFGTIFFVIGKKMSYLKRYDLENQEQMN